MVQTDTFPCRCYLKGKCFCNIDSDREMVWKENVYDLVDVLAIILRMLGLSSLKIFKAKPIIVNTFLEYKNIIHRIDAPPRKCFDRKHLIHQLGTKCIMTRTEAQLTYSIVKRAFRAFYYATDDYGLPDEAQLELLKHTNECYWLHAAEQSAHIFAYFEGMFPATERTYAAKIKCLYKKLYDRMKARFVFLHENKPHMRTCGEKKYRVVDEINTVLVEEENDMATEADQVNAQVVDPCEVVEEEEIPIVEGPRCNCAKLECECAVDPMEEVYAQNYSQDPYICYWKTNYDEQLKEDLIQPDKICTSSTHEEEEEQQICDPECICTCEVCECCCESSGEDVFLEGIEEHSDDYDPCANLKDLLGPPTYPEPQDLGDGDGKDDGDGNKLKKGDKGKKPKKKDDGKKKNKKKRRGPEPSSETEEEPEIVEEKKKIKIKRKPKEKKKGLPCCAVCVPRKRRPPPQPKIEIPSCDSDSEFPDDTKYKT